MLLKVLFLSCLINYCLAQNFLGDLEKEAEPYKPVSPYPISPLLNALKTLLDGDQINPYAASMSAKMNMMAMSGQMQQQSLLMPTTIPEISRIVCGCETTKKCDKKSLKSESEKKVTLDEIKEINNKLEQILKKQAFKHIVKRSTDETTAKDSVKLMLNVFETIKTMFNLNEEKDIEQFKVKLMELPEQKLSLDKLIKTLRPTIKDSSDEVNGCVKASEIDCGFGQQLKIIRASISNENKYSCSASAKLDNPDYEKCTEESMATKIVNETCNGQQSCTINVDEDFPSVCECAPQRYLNLTYSCVPMDKKALLSRSKRTVHYRNKAPQQQRDKALRRMGGLYDYGLYGGLYDYGLYGGLYDYGLYGALPFYDYYYGLAYGLPFYDYYYGGLGGFGLYDYYYDAYPFNIPFSYD